MNNLVNFKRIIYSASFLLKNFNLKVKHVAFGNEFCSKLQLYIVRYLKMAHSPRTVLYFQSHFHASHVCGNANYSNLKCNLRIYTKMFWNCFELIILSQYSPKSWKSSFATIISCQCSPRSWKSNFATKNLKRFCLSDMSKIRCTRT